MDCFARVASPALQILAEMDAQGAAVAFSEDGEVAAGLRGFHNANV